MTKLPGISISTLRFQGQLQSETIRCAPKVFCLLRLYGLGSPKKRQLGSRVYKRLGSLYHRRFDDWVGLEILQVRLQNLSRQNISFVPQLEGLQTSNIASACDPSRALRFP